MLSKLGGGTVTQNSSIVLFEKCIKRWVKISNTITIRYPYIWSPEWRSELPLKFDCSTFYKCKKSWVKIYEYYTLYLISAWNPEWRFEIPQLYKYRELLSIWWDEQFQITPNITIALHWINAWSREWNSTTFYLITNSMWIKSVGIPEIYRMCFFIDKLFLVFFGP